MDEVALRGFDARYGARPLQRTVERLIAGPLAHWIVTQSPAAGGLIRTDWEHDRAVFSIDGTAL